jgi:hypothetical protein
MSVVKAQRRRVVEEAQILAPEAGYPLGIYLLKGWITKPEKDAGEEYARLVAAVKRDYDTPKADAKSGGLVNLMPSAGGSGVPDELMFSDDELRKRRADRLGRYNKAFEALHDAGRPANAAVNQAAIRELHVKADDRIFLKRGLRRLAQHFQAEGA